MGIARPNWGARMGDLDQISSLIRAYEKDLNDRRCIIEVQTPKMVWKKQSEAAFGFRITDPSGKYLTDLPVTSRVAFVTADFEALADLADQAMQQALDQAKAIGVSVP